MLSLEEIERRADERLRADAEEAVRDISEKDQVLSGSAMEPGKRASQISENPMVLSGPAGEMAENRGLAFSENPMVPQGDFLQGVLSGSPNTDVLRLKPLAAALRKGLTKVGLGSRGAVCAMARG